MMTLHRLCECAQNLGRTEPWQPSSTKNGNQPDKRSNLSLPTTSSTNTLEQSCNIGTSSSERTNAISGRNLSPMNSDDSPKALAIDSRELTQFSSSTMNRCQRTAKQPTAASSLTSAHRNQNHNALDSQSAEISSIFLAMSAPRSPTSQRPNACSTVSSRHRAPSSWAST